MDLLFITLSLLLRPIFGATMRRIIFELAIDRSSVMTSVSFVIERPAAETKSRGVPARLLFRSVHASVVMCVALLSMTSCDYDECAVEMLTRRLSRLYVHMES